MFKIGTRVKIVDNGHFMPRHRHFIGRKTIVTGGPIPNTYSHAVPSTGYLYLVECCQTGVHESALVPIVDPKEFERFMHAVLKPVKLDEPVTA